MKAKIWKAADLVNSTELLYAIVNVVIVHYLKKWMNYLQPFSLSKLTELCEKCPLVVDS